MFKSLFKKQPAPRIPTAPPQSQQKTETILSGEYKTQDPRTEEEAQHYAEHTEHRPTEGRTHEDAQPRYHKVEANKTMRGSNQHLFPYSLA